MMTCETLDHLQKNQWALTTDLLTEGQLRNLKNEALRRWQSGQFSPARIGRSDSRQRRDQIRGDWTSWVDLREPAFSDLSSLTENLMSQFNQTFYLGIREFECHLARYAEGQFYEEHIDQSPQSSALHGERVISFVLYLNENWQPEDGGELSLRLAEKEQRIQPHWGHAALFLSDTVPHAVLPARRERWSLTGWFRRS